MRDELNLSSGAWVESPLVVRIAGLPVSCLADLRCEESAARAESLVVMRDGLAVRGETLSVELYDVIGSLADPELKPGLVGLRRALHQVRSPGAREWNERVAGALPADVAERVRAWIKDWREYRQRRAELPEVLAGEAARKQAVLREAVAQPGFRRALSQASPALFAETVKWLADEKRPPRRTTIARLAQYVGRAAAKTSPFSTFTISAVGGWCDADVAARFTGPAQVNGVLELHGLLLAALERFVREDPRLASALEVRVNPSMVRQDSCVSFAGHAPKEPIVTLPATAAVQRCLEIVAGEPGVTLGGLHARLSKTGADGDRVARFVDHLLETGLLELRSPVADQAADPAPELAAWLAGRGEVGCSDIVALLERVERELAREVPVSDVDSQLKRQDALCDAVGELSVRIGLQSRAQTPPKVAFHENTVVVGATVECGRPTWRTALEDLDVVRRCLAPFDLALPLRLALGALCAELFGAGSSVPVLSVHRAVHDQLRGRDADRTEAGQEVARLMEGGLMAPGPDLAASRLPALRQLHRIQHELRQAVPASAGGVVRVDPEALTGLTADWPGWVRPFRSLGCYLQVVGGGPELQLVLNAAHVGHGRGRSRVSHLIGRAGGTAPLNGAGRAPEDLALAEFGGLFGSSLNIRHAALPYEIDYPFTVSTRPARQRIALGDLRVAHDQASGQVRLVCQHLGCEVRPLHLGMMADGLLPPTARFLALTFGQALFLRGGMPPPLLAPEMSKPDSVAKIPRVEIGRVVLRRARWTSPIGKVPRRDIGEADADYLVRLVGWLRAHDIPRGCFIRAMAYDPGTVATDGARWASLAFDSSHKPVYIDFESWHLVKVFERLCDDPTEIVIFEEALPAPHEAVGPSEPDRTVTEFLIEISG